MVYRFFNKKTSGGGIKNGNFSSKDLDEELHKPIFRNFKKRKVHSSFMDNIWVADLANMQLISKFCLDFYFCFNDFDFYYVLLTFSVNTQRLFL